jgi:uncharacterized protein (TIGR01777 family)
MRVIILGGTGMIGKPLAANLASSGYEVIVLTREPSKRRRGFSTKIKLRKWDGRTPQGWGELVDGAEAIINLAGANLAGANFFPNRWTNKRKQILRESRLFAGKAATEAIASASNPPSIFIQSSAVGYYGTSMESTFTEDSPSGEGFLARLCVDWEGSSAALDALNIRRSIIRTAVFLDPLGGSLGRLLLPFKLFVGGKLGSGKQWFPWIHPEDAIRGIRFLLETEGAKGAFNLSAPNPVRNSEFAIITGRVLKRPSLIPLPAFVLKTVLGEVSSVALEGQRTIPKRLQNLGFTFRYPDFEPALIDVLSKI